MIELKNISKSYGDNKVLENINLLIPKGKITAIVGANGAGKSTLIKIMTGFEFADSGNVFINYEKIENFKTIKQLISYMPEYMILYPDYFVDEFLDFFHEIVDYKDRELLEILSLKTVFDKKIKNLSKGWHQRVKLYIALCNKKDIIILDEPFEGFDPLQMRDIAKIIFSQNSKKREFILSIHQLSYAQKICNYFIFLNRGKVIEIGDLKSLSNKYKVDINLEDILIEAIKKCQ